MPLGRGLPTVEPEVVARAIVGSCRSRTAEICVASYLRAWDFIDAVVPERWISLVRSLIDDRRALTSIDPVARRDYDERMKSQTIQREGGTGQVVDGS